MIKYTWLTHNALQNPNAVAIYSLDKSWDYKTWLSYAEGCRYWLQKNNIPSGTKIGLWKADPYMTLAWIFGIIHHGSTVIMLSDRDPKQKIDRLKDQLNIYCIVENILPSPKEGSPPKVDHDHPSIVILSSGSTGSPKVILHTLNNMEHSAQASHQNIAFSQGDRWILSLALWHIGGLAIAFRALYQSATICIGSLREIPDLQVTHTSVVATQLKRIIEHVDLSKLKAILVGGGPIPQGLINRCIELNLPIHTTYGMSELCSQLCTTPAKASSTVLKTAGFPLSCWQIKCSTERELMVKGSPLFIGYEKDGSIHSGLNSDGWFYTGDIAVINTDGSVSILGRKDQMFISGGENIHPEEIERVLTSFKEIKAAVVVPVPCKEFGMRPVAFIYGGDIPNLIERLKEQIPSFKIPDHFFQWPTHIPLFKPSRSSFGLLALQLLQLDQK
ncbi:MAG: hypothetical protein CMK59_11440 [Proteobacteria bacterium]|nr:hypothetical protein [Pseudomonadota bacterium]